MDFQEYSNYSRDSILPKCPSCYATRFLKMIDVVIYCGEISPVWHCDKCDRVFGEHSSVSYSSSSIKRHIDQADVVSSAPTPEQIDFNLMVGNVNQLSIELDNLKQEMTKIKTDPLSMLRSQVDTFSL